MHIVVVLAIVSFGGIVVAQEPGLSRERNQREKRSSAVCGALARGRRFL